MTASITSYGTYVPEKVLSNFDLEKMVETNNEWIVERTGIEERRICGDDEFTLDLAIKAVEDMVERFPDALEGVDQIIFTSMTPDNYCPNMASLVQGHFGIENCGAIDMNSACSGFVYALNMAYGLISNGFHRKVLVIGADAMSKIVDYTDRTICILFGDAGGAVIVEKSEQNDFLNWHAGTNGEKAENLVCSGLSTKFDTNRFLKQNGREVYKWAVTTVSNGTKLLLEKSEFDMDSLDYFVPHSANLRIIESISKRLKLPEEKIICSLVKHGNTSSASIPLAMVNAIDDGRLKKDHVIMVYGYGGGLTHAGLILKLNSI